MASAADIAIMPVLTGQSADGKWPERKEIDAFVEKTNAKQVFLFFAALTELQSRKPDDPWSYFQIAGIHGQPWRPWPPNKGNKTDNREFEYCAHWNIFFPTWHRVYCFMYERALYDIMMAWVKPKNEEQEKKSIIPQQSRAAYIKAVETWRLPFWDLGTSKPYNKDGLSIPKCAAFPKLSQEMGHAWEALTADEVKDVAPQWLEKHKDNPLYAYRFPDDSTAFGLPVNQLSNKMQTTRHPKANGEADINGVKNKFYNWTASFRSSILINMVGPKSFFRFVGANESMTSIQGPHGDGHINIGGQRGTMASQSYAAYDPIFWLHHCNIDRLIALWQAGHPGPDPKFWLTAQEDKEPLKPFYDAKRQPWISSRLRNINALGYTYRVLNGVNNEATFRQKITDMYSDPNLRIILDVIVTASFEVNEIGPFLITFYWMKGESKAPSDPPVGEVLNFTADLDEGAPCTNCEKNRAEKRKGTLATNINVRLQDSDLYGSEFRTWRMADLEKRVPDINKRLFWRVFKTGGNGDEIPLDKFPSLKVIVSAFEKTGVDAGKGLESGVGSTPPVVLRGATAGNPGGLGEDEGLPWDED